MVRKKRIYYRPQKLDLKIPFILGIIFLILLSVAIVKDLMRRIKIEQSISSLEKQIKKEEKRNKYLSKLLEFLNESSFKEKEARLKLGMQKPGEKVFIIVPSPSGSSEEKEKQTSSKSNIQKWLEYFLNH